MGKLPHMTCQQKNDVRTTVQVNDQILYLIVFCLLTGPDFNNDRGGPLMMDTALGHSNL